MLLGIMGQKRVGKDTAHFLLKQQYPEIQRIAFADKMKESLAALLGINLSQLNELKLNSRAKFTLVVPSEERFNFKPIHIEMTMRELLQRYGTESHRDVFGRRFWVDMTLPSTFNHQDQFFVVTDVRFPEEIDRIRELGGHIIKIVRDQKMDVDNHSSENSLNDYDFLINNNFGLHFFKDELIKVVKFIKDDYSV